MDTSHELEELIQRSTYALRGLLRAGKFAEASQDIEQSVVVQQKAMFSSTYWQIATPIPFTLVALVNRDWFASSLLVGTSVLMLLSNRILVAYARRNMNKDLDIVRRASGEATTPA